jgi:hypothetical protein
MTQSRKPKLLDLVAVLKQPLDADVEVGFVDTGAHYALTDASDPDHEEVVRLFCLRCAFQYLPCAAWTGIHGCEICAVNNSVLQCKGIGRALRG